MDIAQTGVQIKARLLALAGADISSTARLIAALEAAGITDRAEVESLTGCSDRTVRRARSELAAAKNDRSKMTESGQEWPKPAKNDRSEMAAPRVRAHLESPSGIDPSQVVVVIPPDPPAPVANSKRGARLPAEWTLPDDWFEWSRISFVQVSPDTIRFEADKFRDHWHSKAGAQGCKLDWGATWRNWCRTAFGNPGSGKVLNYGRHAWDERRAAGSMTNFDRKIEGARRFRELAHATATEGSA